MAQESGSSNSTSNSSAVAVRRSLLGAGSWVAAKHERACSRCRRQRRPGSRSAMCCGAAFEA